MKNSLVLKVIVILFFIMVLMAGALVALGFYADSKIYGIIPKHTQIAGVDVSNMTPDQARMAVTDELDQRKQGYTLTIEGGAQPETIDLSPYLTFDIDKQVQEAVSPHLNDNPVERIVYALKLYFGIEQPEPRDLPVSYKFGTVSVKEKVEGLAAGVNKDPVDATRKISGDTVTITPGQDGQYVNVDSTVSQIDKELDQFKDGKLPKEKKFVAKLVIETAAPSVTAESFGSVITINLTTHKLYLFEGSTLVKTYSIGCGRPGYETPTGLLKIINKRKNPVWINPSPEGWGKDMAPRIEPGVNNPLGLRALDLNRPAIRIHGVSDPGRIGRSRSHGCINMMNDDVIDLFDRVSVDTPVNVHY